MIPVAQLDRSRALDRLAAHAAMLIARRSASPMVRPGDPVTVDGHGDGVLIAIGPERARSWIAGVPTVSAASAVHLREIEA